MHPSLASLPLKNLLTMTSGLSVNERELRSQPNRIDYLLQQESSGKPGEKFNYNAANSEILGALIKKSTGYFADAFAKQYLFDPLGITNFDWQIFKQNGYPLCGGSLWLTPRDMARIGLLVLNRGKWRDNQIISREWVAESTRGHIKTGIGSDEYGYHWWVSEIKSGNQKYRLIWANGLGSQFIFIFPELEMVAVTTGGNWAGGDSGRSWDIFKLFEKYLPALTKKENRRGQ